MDTYKYQQFLRKSRDKIAEWIDHPKVKALFAADMKQAESLLQANNKEFEQKIKQEKEFLKSPQGQKWRRENSQWEQKNLIPIHEVQWSDESDKPVHPPKPGTRGRPRTPKEMNPEWPESPLAKYTWPITLDPFTINDYRVLLGALHDGVTKDRRDLPDYICPELWGLDTFEFALYIMVKNNPEYQALIKKALRIVEGDINDQEQKGKGQAETEQKAATKRQRIWIFIKGLVKEIYRITIKSFFDSAMNK